MNATIYARYSDSSQRDESIEGQLRECKEYAEKNGITVISSYIDRALSARSDARPEFQRMIRDSAKRLFDVIIVWKTKIFCGHDGVFMAGESGTSKSLKVHRYYRCVNTKKKRLCDKKPIRKALIENLVIDAVMEMIADDNIVSYIVDTAMELQKRESSSLPLLTQQL